VLGAHRVSATVGVVAVIVGPGGALVHPALAAHGEHEVDVHERLLRGWWCSGLVGRLTPRYVYIQGHGLVQNAKVMAQILSTNRDLDLDFVLTDS
jgi:hypothetical protein